MVSIDEVKKLRSETGVSISKCKEALESVGGDFDKAREALRQKGSLAADKKAHRDLNAGVVQAYVHGNNTLGVIVELLCETDFVARNEDFILLAREIALHTAALKPLYVSRDEISDGDMKTLMKEIEDELPEGSPEDKKEQILKGKLDARLKEVVLLEQPFVKDDSQTIRQLLDNSVFKIWREN